MINRIISILFILFLCHIGAFGQAKWITVDNDLVNQKNTWIAFRKDINLTKKPDNAITQIAVDSKYWLWINGSMVVFEGGLKRGPNPYDTYFDEIDLAPFLRKGKNTIAVLVWYFGKEGFSHKDSGKAGLLFQMKSGNQAIVSDRSWLSTIHPAYQTASDPEPNFRLPESNILFVANKDLDDWLTKQDLQQQGFKLSKEIGLWGSAPWNGLVKRPIPFWKDFGIKQADFILSETEKEFIYTAKLPYNMQMTPILEIEDQDGNTKINIETDHFNGGSATNLRAEYITKKGWQSYESLGWLNGQKIILRIPKQAKTTIKSISYRETGFAATVEGSFTSDRPFINTFWNKALRTLYINMRDTYFDCPDRERAQWWGDVVVLMGESFYTYSSSANSLMKKAIHELVDWQKKDSVLFSPIPAGNYNNELPAQMLASIGHYGFWNYYMHTADRETLAHVYPAVKKYLGLWALDDTGLTVFRNGGWSWGDWGQHIDIRLLLAGWHYLALQSAAQMADELQYFDDAVIYRNRMKTIKEAYNKCWNGYAYRHPTYMKETDDRVQAMAVIAGIAEQDKYPSIYPVLRQQSHASPYMEKYVMESLVMMGYGEYAIERMEKKFSNMVLDTNYTTLFEDWGVGGAGGGSTNHAWSGGPLTVIAQYICGIEPLEPGYRTFKIEPNPAPFKEINISIPTIKGLVKSDMKQTKDELSLHITVPAGTKGIVYLPITDDEKVLINNSVDSTPYQLSQKRFAKKDKIAYEFSSGSYSISMKR